MVTRRRHEELMGKAADLEMRRAAAAAEFDHAQERFWLECLEDITYQLREAEHNAAADRYPEYDHDERGHLFPEADDPAAYRWAS